MKEDIISQIYILRGRKVMLDSDLARIYGVKTARLNQQVRRNIDRFPDDFMFELTSEESRNLMLQFAISSSQHAEQLMLVFEALRELVQKKEEPRTAIGFIIRKNEGSQE